MNKWMSEVIYGWMNGWVNDWYTHFLCPIVLGGYGLQAASPERRRLRCHCMVTIGEEMKLWSCSQNKKTFKKWNVLFTPLRVGVDPILATSNPMSANFDRFLQFSCWTQGWRDKSGSGRELLPRIGSPCARKKLRRRVIFLAVFAFFFAPRRRGGVRPLLGRLVL